MSNLEKRVAVLEESTPEGLGRKVIGAVRVWLSVDGDLNSAKETAQDCRRQILSQPNRGRYESWLLALCDLVEGAK